jgi:hypothetical protein
VLEPIGIAFATGAAGILGKKLSESATQWIAERFGPRTSIAAQQAQVNGEAFLSDLADRVQRLEETGRITSGEIDNALERPDTLAMIRSAFNGASEKNDVAKKEILSRLVVDRLTAKQETVQAVATRRVAETIPYLTSRQLHTLGILSLIFGIRPIISINMPSQAPDILKAEYSKFFIQWLQNFARMYPVIEYSNNDALHMESLSLMKATSFLITNLAQVLAHQGQPKIDFDASLLQDTPFGKNLIEAWEKGWKNIQLTLAGHVLGVYVHDHLTKQETLFKWED